MIHWLFTAVGIDSVDRIDCCHHHQYHHQHHHSRFSWSGVTLPIKNANGSNKGGPVPSWPTMTPNILTMKIIFLNIREIDIYVLSTIISLCIAITGIHPFPQIIIPLLLSVLYTGCLRQDIDRTQKSGRGLDTYTHLIIDNDMSNAGFCLCSYDLYRSPCFNRPGRF